MEIPLTIHETKKGLLDKKFSCVGLVDAYLKRINTFDKDLNSLLSLKIDMELSFENMIDCERTFDVLRISPPNIGLTRNLVVDYIRFNCRFPLKSANSRRYTLQRHQPGSN